MVRCGFRKCKPFVLSWCGFLQAVFVPGGAVFFVMGWGFTRGSCTRLCFWFGAVCVSASRGAFCGVGFYQLYLFLGCTQLCLLCWAVCVSASRLFCRGVFFCKLYLFLAVRFFLSWGVFFTGAVVRSCVCCAGRFA